MRVTAKVTGARQIITNGIELEKQLARGAMRDAMTKAARPMTAAVKRNAPVGRTGLLKKSIKQKVKTSRKKGMVTAVIGPSNKIKGIDPVTKKEVRPSRYAHLVEKGSASRGVWGRKGVKVTPGSPPNPFMRTAYASTKSKVADVYKREMGPAVQRSAARLKKRALKSLT